MDIYREEDKNQGDYILLWITPPDLEAFLRLEVLDICLTSPIDPSENTEIRLIEFSKSYLSNIWAMLTLLVSIVVSYEAKKVVKI